VQEDKRSQEQNGVNELIQYQAYLENREAKRFSDAGS